MKVNDNEMQYARSPMRRQADREVMVIILRYLVHNGRSVVFRGGRFRLAISKKLEDHALCCEDEAGRSAFVFARHFLRLQSDLDRFVNGLTDRIDLSPAGVSLIAVCCFSPPRIAYA